MRLTQTWRVWPFVASMAVASALALHGNPSATDLPRFEQVALATPYPSTTYTATASSDDGTNTASKAVDGSPSTQWRALAAPASLTLDAGAPLPVGGLQFTPPVTGSDSNIGGYAIASSNDGSSFSPVASGTWADDSDVKTVAFPTPVKARYFRLTAQSSTGSHTAVGAAEVMLLNRGAATTQHPSWAISADSEQGSAPATNAIDGHNDSVWKSSNTAYPHSATVDVGAVGTYSELQYTPNQDGSGNVLDYRVSTSTDGTTWTLAAAGQLANDRVTKTITFKTVNARYLRFVAVDGQPSNNDHVTSAAELEPVQGTAPATPQPGQGTWSAPINFPIIPAAVSLLPNGKIVAWSSDDATTYAGGGGVTHTVLYDPVSGGMTHVVTNTGQDMFCPGIALLPDGRLLVSGGHINSAKVSIYNPALDKWGAARPMALPRGYQSSVTQADGSVFIIGGSWNDGNDGPSKNGELWTPTTGGKVLTGAAVSALLTNDREGKYRQDNHAWLFAWAGKVFQAGPSKQMNFYSTAGVGSVQSAGLRGTDGDAMNGAAAMYSPGVILTVGGAPNYTGTAATSNANVINLTKGTPIVTKVGSMHYPRSFASAVVLPDGKTFISGGMQFPKTFSDATAVMTPELFDPATSTFSDMADMQIPRTYHSEALLMPDGRVFVGGGGLCETIDKCVDANHADAQIYTPPYLLKPDGSLRVRATLSGTPTIAYPGKTYGFRSNHTLTKAVLVRVSAVTHSVNTDQRRVPVGLGGTLAKGYTMSLPKDTSTLIPGTYMLFGIFADGTPSVAKFVTVR